MAIVSRPLLEDSEIKYRNESYVLMCGCDVGSDRCTEIGQNISVYSVDAVAWTQSTRVSDSGILTSMAGHLANNNPAKVPVIIAVVWFNTLRYALWQPG
jgi:hypothetical protein